MYAKLDNNCLGTIDKIKLECTRDDLDIFGANLQFEVNNAIQIFHVENTLLGLDLMCTRKSENLYLCAFTIIDTNTKSNMFSISIPECETLMASMFHSYINATLRSEIFCYVLINENNPRGLLMEIINDMVTMYSQNNKSVKYMCSFINNIFLYCKGILEYPPNTCGFHCLDKIKQTFSSDLLMNIKTNQQKKKLSL